MHDRKIVHIDFRCFTLLFCFLFSHEIDIFGIKVVVKSGLGKIILNFTEPLQSCCCPVQENLPRKAELAWQVSRYL